MPHCEIFLVRKACLSAVIHRETFILPDGARLKRVSMGDFTNACQIQSCRIMRKGENPALEYIYSALIDRGSAEASEELSWQGDLATDGMQLCFNWMTATVADSLCARILVEWP